MYQGSIMKSEVLVMWACSNTAPLLEETFKETRNNIIDDTLRGNRGACAPPPPPPDLYSGAQGMGLQSGHSQGPVAVGWK